PSKRIEASASSVPTTTWTASSTPTAASHRLKPCRRDSEWLSSRSRSPVPEERDCALDACTSKVTQRGPIDPVHDGLRSPHRSAPSRSERHRHLRHRHRPLEPVPLHRTGLAALLGG